MRSPRRDDDTPKYPEKRNDMSDMNNEASTPQEHDELLGRLAEADPIGPGSIPSSVDQNARRLIDNIVATEIHGGTTSATMDTDQHPVTMTADRLDADEISTRRRARIDAVGSGPRRQLPGRMALLGAVAAVLLLVVGLTVLVPDASTPALAQVKPRPQPPPTPTPVASPRPSRPARSIPKRELQIAGTVQAAYSGADLSVSVDAEGSGSVAEEFPAGEVPAGELRLVGDALYVQVGEQWYRADTDGMFGSIITETRSPIGVGPGAGADRNLRGR